MLAASMQDYMKYTEVTTFTTINEDKKKDTYVLWEHQEKDLAFITKNSICTDFESSIDHMYVTFARCISTILKPAEKRLNARNYERSKLQLTMSPIKEQLKLQV